jgi:adenylosuccinate lyase
VQRDRHAEFMSALAISAASLEKVALEIRSLQRTEILEAEEPFSEGQKGSSAMPHKRNPVSCEQVCGLARLVRSNAGAAYENVALWHERDISHSSVERVILPDSTILLDYLQHRATALVEGMTVDSQRMRENLELTHGALFSQRLLLAVVGGGMERDQAYRIVQELAQRAWDEGTPLRELLAADERVAPLGLDLDDIFDYSHYIRYAREIVARLDFPLDAGAAMMSS